MNAEAFTGLLDHLAEALAPRIASKLPPRPPSASASPDAVAEGVPHREYLTQREAAAWTGLSVSSLRRARKNGLPYKKALGQVTYHIADLRDLMGGSYNGDQRPADRPR